MGPAVCTGGLDVLGLQTDDGGHGAFAGRHRGLHGVAANAQQPGRVGNREHAGGAQRRIFTERMAGDITGGLAKIEPARLEHPDQRHRHRHQRRLGVGGECQRLLGAFEDYRRKLFAKRRVDLVKDGSCFRIGGGKILAHTDRLAALPRKSECYGHVSAPMIDIPLPLQFTFTAPVSRLRPV